LRKEGARERHRIRSRLHELTRSLVNQLAEHRAVLALEDLTGLPRPRRRSSKSMARRFGSRPFRRRLSNWPRGELHRQLRYQAEDRGIPIVWLNPYRTSRTCPKCGEVSKYRRRVGTRFDCAKCG
jgi:IS605 OrfB family transposase